MGPKFPIYIVSKGRADTRLTALALEKIGVDYSIIVEEQEADTYRAVIDPRRVIVLDKAYQRNYDTFDTLGDTKSKGPGPARNFVWQHSIDAGHEWHWVMDDNIRIFYRLNRNRRIPVLDGTIFKVMEDFCLRYENIAMAGPQYRMFAPSRNKTAPIVFNTRVYSCNLICNRFPFRWRGRYNEDTDLSLQQLKAGLCTIQFYSFLQDKITTQALKGGNTAEFYAAEGTLPKSQMLVAMHPDVTRLVLKYGRWHHHVDYGPFKSNKLRLRAGAEIPAGVNEYGMRIINA